MRLSLKNGRSGCACHCARPLLEERCRLLPLLRSELLVARMPKERPVTLLVHKTVLVELRLLTASKDIRAANFCCAPKNSYLRSLPQALISNYLHTPERARSGFPPCARERWSPQSHITQQYQIYNPNAAPQVTTIVPRLQQPRFQAQSLGAKRSSS